MVQDLIIPWFTLAVLYIGLYGRVLRASLIEAHEGGLHPHRAGQGPHARRACCCAMRCAPR